MKKNKELDSALLAALAGAYGDEGAKGMKKGKPDSEGVVMIIEEKKPEEKAEAAPKMPEKSPHDEMMSQARAAEEVCSLADRIRDLVMKKKGKVEEVDEE